MLEPGDIDLALQDFEVARHEERLGDHGRHRLPACVADRIAERRRGANIRDDLRRIILVGSGVVGDRSLEPGRQKSDRGLQGPLQILLPGVQDRLSLSLVLRRRLITGEREDRPLQGPLKKAEGCDGPSQRLPEGRILAVGGKRRREAGTINDPGHGNRLSYDQSIGRSWARSGQTVG